jgi:hypothetical protein
VRPPNYAPRQDTDQSRGCSVAADRDGVAPENSTFGAQTRYGGAQLPPYC